MGSVFIPYNLIHIRIALRQSKGKSSDENVGIVVLPPFNVFLFCVGNLMVAKKPHFPFERRAISRCIFWKLKQNSIFQLISVNFLKSFWVKIVFNSTDGSFFGECVANNIFNLMDNLFSSFTNDLGTFVCIRCV